MNIIPSLKVHLQLYKTAGFGRTTGELNEQMRIFPSQSHIYTSKKNINPLLQLCF